MTSLHHAQSRARHSPTLVRKSAIKAARSAPSSKSAGTPKVTIKRAKASKYAKEEEEEEAEVFDFEDDDMGTTFLQYWFVLVLSPLRDQVFTSYSSAMCEKQILVPNSSILYCSER